MKKFSLAVGIFFFATVLFATPACSRGSEKVSVEVLGHNYTDQYIDAYTVNGAYMGNARAKGYGGFTCCVNLPQKWKPGLKVTISWTKNEKESTSWKTVVVDIPEYSLNDVGHLAVHFFPNDEVKVLVTDKYVGHPSYPYPSPTGGR